MSSNLIRYGVHWKGAKEPICTPMDDGYWTPWHLAQAEIDALKAQCDEFLGVLQMVADGCGVLDISERGQLYEAIAKARGDQA